MSGLDNPAATAGTALLSALMIQYLKNCSWATWFTRDTERANLALSILIAGAASLGVGYTFDAKEHTLLITGLSLANIGHNGFQWLLQWGAQHGFYKGFIVLPETLGEIRALLARVLTPPSISPADAKAKDH